MSGTNSLVKYITVVAVVAIFAITLNDWDSTSATVTGYDDLQNTLSGTDSTGESTFPRFPNITAPQAGDCDFWDLLCHGENIGGPLAYFANLVWSSITFFFSVIGWFLIQVFNLITAGLAVATLTMDGFPPEIQLILWIFALPMMFLILWSFLKLLRGSN